MITKRNQIIAMRKRLACQIKQRGTDILEDMDSEHMALLDTQLARIDARIAQMLEQDEELNRKACCMRSVPGVGPVLARALIADMAGSSAIILSSKYSLIDCAKPGNRTRSS